LVPLHNSLDGLLIAGIARAFAGGRHGFRLVLCLENSKTVM
jgi:hypothetical protein